MEVTKYKREIGLFTAGGSEVAHGPLYFDTGVSVLLLPPWGLADKALQLSEPC
jgi:hypothetical protein